MTPNKPLNRTGGWPRNLKANIVDRHPVSLLVRRTNSQVDEDCELAKLGTSKRPAVVRLQSFARAEEIVSLAAMLPGPAGVAGSSRTVADHDEFRWDVDSVL